MPLDNTLLLELLRMRAKRLRSEQGIPLARAQDVLAIEHGLPNWPALKRHLEAGESLAKGPLGDLCGLTRRGVEPFLRSSFYEAVAEGQIGLESDNQDYAGDLSFAFTMDVRDWLVEQYPDLAELFPNQLTAAEERIEQNGPWRLLGAYDD